MSGAFDHVLVSDLSGRFRQFLCERLVHCWRSFLRQLPFNEVSEEVIHTLDDENIAISEKCFQAFRIWCQLNPATTWEYVALTLYKLGEKQLLTECKNMLAREDIGKMAIENKIEIASEELRNCYRMRYAKMERMVHNSTMDEFVNMDDVYVDLKLNSSMYENEKWTRFVDREFFISQRNNDWENIKTKELFKDGKRFAIVSGIVGIGKTTLLKHSLMQWVEKRQWDEFQFVFHINCRDLNYLNSSCNTLEGLLKKLFPTIMWKLPFQTLCEAADRVLFVVDGIDEFQFLDDLLHICRGKVDISPIAMCLYGVMNPSAKHRVLISGRPEAASKLERMLLVDRPLCVNVVGFSEDSVQQYIAKRAGDNVELKSQITDIARLPSMQIMATVPIYLEIICSILETNNDTTVRTLTELYTWVLFYYIQKHFKNFKGESRSIHISIHELFCDTDVMETLDYVCKMAYLMLKEGRIVFNSKTFGRIPGGSVEFFGLISKVKLSQLEDVYEFKHLSLMEFCSALYIFKNLSNEVDTLVNEPRLKGCIPIVCGLEGALNDNADTPLIVRMFVEALKVPHRSSSWLSRLLEQNEETHFEMMSDEFLALFLESQSSIPDHLAKHFSRSYAYCVDDCDATRCSQFFYFANQLLESGCLHFRMLGVNCKRDMPREKQSILIKMLCSAENIDIDRLPPNFDEELLQLSRNCSLKKLIIRCDCKQMKMLLPLVIIAEELWLSRIDCWSVEERVTLYNALKSNNSLKRVGDMDTVQVVEISEEVSGQDSEGKLYSLIVSEAK